MDHKMFCFQCEQTAGCVGCTGKAGVCGKTAEAHWVLIIASGISIVDLSMIFWIASSSFAH